MVRKLLILVTLLLLNGVVFYGAYLNLQKKGAPAVVMTAAPVPDFNWTDLAGKTHSIKELAGKVVVIHFWATWCAPCRHEFPRLLASAGSLGSDIVFLTISVDDDRELVKKFLTSAEEKAGVKSLQNVLYGIDLQKTIAFDVFQSTAFPESIVVDAEQKMRRKFVGSAGWGSPEMAEMLNSYRIAH